MINDRIMPATNSTASTAPDAMPPPPAPAADSKALRACSRIRSTSARDTSKGESSTSQSATSSMPSLIVGPISSA